MIKSVNEESKEVYISSTKVGEKGAMLVVEDDWSAIQETLFLLNTGVIKQIEDRKNEEDIDFNNTWNHL
ncbi:hypothetical protein [Abyssicoccus albus]|uniref:hypothetical protein n=1 Tax=Abyssicoccus albus TaxID=1817405 RepID=UPI00097E3EA6|nr:hypothetical protein [Abyssicoccus albus]AQL55599.1 hypothetical protein BVH56_00855 [Abyssicoccus albus]